MPISHRYLPIAGLLLLAAVPVIGGSVRMVQFAAGTAPLRFESVWPMVAIHIAGSIVLALAGPFQFVTAMRNRPLHRRMGRLVFHGGLATAISGLVLSVGSHLPLHDGTSLMVIRLIVGSAMLGFLLAGAQAIRTGNIRSHMAFMTRAYALGMGAGTQVVIGMPFVLTVGMPDRGARAVMMGLGWAINLAVAEWYIRRRALARRPA